MTVTAETETFPVQHDRALLEAKATALTGLPATAGETHLAFLATLTPVRSGPVRFSMHGDGYVEGAWVDCPACGRPVSDGEVGSALTLREQVENLMALAGVGRFGGLVRFARRYLITCPTCGPDARSLLAHAKYEARPADFVDPRDARNWDDEDED